MQAFVRGKSAQTAHLALLASVQIMDRAKQNAVLWFADIKQRQLYRQLGYSSMNMYAKQALGFSETRASDFSRLADRLEELPGLRGALERGEIGYTKASQVARVCNGENEGAWLDVARTSSRRELERKIKRARGLAAGEQKGQPELLLPAGDAPAKAANVPAKVADAPAKAADAPAKAADVPAKVADAPAAGVVPAAGPREEARLVDGPPTHVPPVDGPTAAAQAAPLPAAVVPVRQTTEFSPEQFARYEALLEKIKKAGGALPASRAEAQITLLAAYAEGLPDFRRRKSEAPAFQIHVHRCPDCRRASVQTGRGELPVTPATAERAHCDARVDGLGRRNTATIPPRIRRRVLSRDRHRCRRSGCENTRFLEVHHIIPRTEGGGNEPANLITLCSACHQLVHEKKWALAAMVRERAPQYGTSSGGLPLKWPPTTADVTLPMLLCRCCSPVPDGKAESWVCCEENGCVRWPSSWACWRWPCWRWWSSCPPRRSATWPWPRPDRS